MKIYTKAGDLGTTSGLDAIPVSKNNKRINALGSIDELNSLLGVVVTLLEEGEEVRILKLVQKNLFGLGSYISSHNSEFVEHLDVRTLESQIDHWTKQLPPLRNFILPGGSNPGAMVHLARSVSRRLERDMVALHEEQALDTRVLQYFNRLSDWLFTLARFINMRMGAHETIWDRTG